jgi:hypothetical protein
MMDQIENVINSLRKQLGEEGYTLYAMKPNDTPPLLVMYNSDRKCFAVFAFTSEEGVYSQLSVWLTLAESKAETFGLKQVSSYMVFKDISGMWKIENETQGGQV